MKISVCIATYLRPDCLRALLSDLVAQRLVPFEVIVVDNDANASARSVVEEFARRPLPFNLIYDIEPERNIALTRNKTVELANCEWLAFVDDDERAPRAWLAELAATGNLHGADGVLGPVIPILPIQAPRWITLGGFYDWPRLQTGRSVPHNHLRFGNVLVRTFLLKGLVTPFDPAYGLTGGEDGDLLSRLVNNGAKIIWCDEGCVTEPIVSSRLSLRWLAKRSLRGGQDYSRHLLAGRYGAATTVRRLGFMLRAGLQAVVAAAFAIVMLAFGRHASAYWALKVCANVGKLSAFFGWHYREYAEAAVIHRDLAA